jgi:hypothetical protein
LIPSRGIKRHWHFLVVIAFVIADILSYAGAGWLPHDEGLLGQAASRVLQGELPHRDFDDTYTGGQALLHALVFRLLGQDSLSLRVLLGLFSVTSILAVYYLALRVASPLVACLGTATGYVWSLPVYFAPLPSWYNLFFGLFGICALVQFAETKRERWLLVAGLFGGLSFLIKISGLYFIAAAFLFLVMCSRGGLQSEANATDLRVSQRRIPLWIGLMVVVPFVMAVSILIRSRWTLMDLLHFGFPSVAVCIALCFIQSQRQAASVGDYFQEILRRMSLFCLGCLAPIALFLVPYANSGSLVVWAEGVFVLPQRRLGSASHPLPSPESLLAVFPVAIVLLGRVRADSWIRGRLFFSLFPVVCVLVALAGDLPSVYSGFWNSSRPLVPLLVGIGSWQIARRAMTRSINVRDEVIFLVIAMVSTMELVQFPFSYPVYFCYIAPLVVLSALGVANLVGHSLRNVQICVLVCYLLFGLIWLRTGYVASVGSQHLVVRFDDPLGLKRASLAVPAFEGRLYRSMIEEVQRRSEPGSAILAMSDCPEVYFLAERRNPTRTLYDFFDADFKADSDARRSRILSLVQEQNIRCIVFRWRGEFSGELDRRLVDSIVELFPNRSDYRFFPEDTSTSKPDFSVLWR